jgi:hypothetical protein
VHTAKLLQPILGCLFFFYSYFFSPFFFDPPTEYRDKRGGGGDREYRVFTFFTVDVASGAALPPGGIFFPAVFSVGSVFLFFLFL